MSYVHDFVRCLNTMSHSRAGWDVELTPEERAKENAQEKDALAEGRRIWDAADEEQRSVLREAFSKAQPLASITEFDRAAK